MLVRGISQSRLAGESGVSRQLMSYWLSREDKNINIHSENLERIAKILNVPMGTLCQSLPIVENKEERRTIESELLWDRLFPDLERFLSAAIRGNTAALARLVQTYGMFTSEKIVGKIVWRRFPVYERCLPPQHRRQVRALWKHQTKN